MKHPMDFWNERFGHDYYVYGMEPNRWFAEQLAMLGTGKLLLPAEGEGRNAVHAASAGWRVTAYDMSEQGRNKALQLAASRDVSFTYVTGGPDVLQALPHDFDAVAMIYAHFEAAERAALNAEVLRHLRQGGVLIMEAFALAQLDYQPLYNSGGPRQADMLFTTAQVREEFAGLSFTVLEEVEVILHEGRGHEGLAKVVRAVGVKS
ncbi:MAG TPA: class I SAM-dependent methyltransferase [Flavobacteriales bacterium]|nr:class I SAM-dependent methyltransferase [Flavobacteriales bacterium]